MASTSSRQDSTTKGDANAPADAAPKTEVSEDLAQIKSAVVDAQRAAESVSDEVDQDAVDTVEAGVADAKGGTDPEQAGNDPDDAIGEIVSALEEVEGAQQASGESATLKEYDEAIAGAVDEMLEGDFVSVDLVLEGMNEVTPPPVPTAEESEPTDEQAEVPEAEDAGAEKTDEAITEGPAPEVKATPSPTSVATEAGTEDAAREGERVEVTSGAARNAPSPAPAAPAAEAAPKEAPASSPASSKPRRAGPAALEDAEPAPAGPREPGAAAGAIHTVVQFAGPAFRMGVIPMLELMSMPMKLVPPRVRDIIDWIALSLIFWVPIVWIFALFVVG